MQQTLHQIRFLTKSFHSNFPYICIGLNQDQREPHLVTSFCTTYCTKAGSGCSDKLKFWAVEKQRNDRCL